eukprot:GFUD01043215.1.p1 GENE.GFUD01043215.1~~GFUD01043215.1.p1  ORF type:complete len:333 (+),score=90.51 GFUD01043215.1:50-1048(+)
MEAWVTLATNDDYAVGALTLAASLKRVETSKKLVIIITNTVSENVKKTLNEAFDEVTSVEAMDSGDLANLTLLDRTELGITFTKVRCWTLTQYTKCVFLDADTLVLAHCDELFEREELSAAPDAGWPDCFNSGVFVFRPNLNTYKNLINLAVTSGSFDGGDQGLLNTFFSDWSTKDISRHLPFTYNMVASATYSYLPAYKKFGQNVKIIHFIGAAKPWSVNFDGCGEAVVGTTEKHTLSHLKLWWQIFSTEVKPGLAKNAVGPAPGKATVPCMSSGMNSTYCSTPPPPKQDSRDEWEAGKPDYSGSASFSNIMDKIDKTLNDPTVGASTEKK